MILPPTLLIRVLSALAIVVALAGDARAQSQGTCIGDIAIDLWIPDSNGRPVKTATSDVRVTEYFNLARCECAAAGDAASSFEFRLTATDTMVESARAELHVGNNCENDDPIRRLCLPIAEISNVQDLRSETTYTIPANQFMFPVADPSGACPEAEGQRNVFVLFDVEGDDLYENHCALPAAIGIDAKPPLLPSTIDIASAENAVSITWNLPTSATDIKYFHVLCTREGESTPVFSDRSSEAEYDTPQTLCEQPFTYGDDLPEALAGLDPAFICATAPGSASSVRIGNLENYVTYDFVFVAVDAARNAQAIALGPEEPAPVVDFWEDYNNRGGTAEGGVCLVNSTFGGGSGPTQAMRDFRDETLAHFALGRTIIDSYYDYVAPLGAYVDRSPALRVVAALALMPLAGLAAFWEYTGPIAKLLVLFFFVALSRRVRGVVLHGASNLLRKRRWGPPAPAVAMALLAVLAVVTWMAPAHAQSANDPWGDEYQTIDEETAPVGRSYWNFGLKLGPYVPAIDRKLELAEDQMGPYEQMFGGSALMGAIELDRYFLWPLGQLGVTASVGWMSKSGKAYETTACTDPAAPGCIDGGMIAVDENGNPIPSPGETTAFRLIPASLGVVYRFTELDDRFRIPVVPYGKAGLSYYLWWITQPDGSIAEAPTDACPDPADAAMDCEGNRALGASLGWQASLGLAVRAERIDRAAARSLSSQFGIEHAGLYAEMTYARVDGFGSDSRLSVGGFTWFGGMNFEF